MNLKKKICAVLFSNAEEEFLESIYCNNVKESKRILTITVLRSAEYTKFREITGMSIDEFLTGLHTFFTTHYREYAAYDLKKRKWDKTPTLEQECAFPECKSENDIQRDHIIPSSLNKTNSFPFTKTEQNMLPLCSFHNRVKTNSILMGIAFLVDSK